MTVFLLITRRNDFRISAKWIDGLDQRLKDGQMAIGRDQGPIELFLEDEFGDEVLLEIVGADATFDVMLLFHHHLRQVYKRSRIQFHRSLFTSFNTKS